MKQDKARIVLQNGHNVLLTGAAGSGKTFLLESFAQWALEKGKKVSVTATTGLAATNINGTTIHNWSGIGVRKQNDFQNETTIPNIVSHMLSRYRQAIKITDILIIDEISMLHSYQLDAIDKIVKGIRKNPETFGGIQVVLCGDFFQLPPPQSKDEKDENVEFITKSTAFQKGDFKVCYLEEYFRHNKTDKLTELLNAIRANNFNNDYWDILNSRKNVKLHATTITKICTTNDVADQINDYHLAQLQGDSKLYQWQTEGSGDPMNKLLKECKNKVVPKLYLKCGATVMFNKNEPTGKYFNGSLGKVVSFDEDGWPNVQLNDRNIDGEIIQGKLIKGLKFTDFWKEDENGQRLATIRQIPLKLAWAITVHKSQGMTIDAAEIDLSYIFDDGLGYVALSRVRSLNDLSITGINHRAVEVNPMALNLEQRLQDLSQQTIAITVEKKPTLAPVKEIKFLTTQGINYHLDKLVKNAKKHIILVSPYIKLNQRLQELLKEKKREGVKIVFICKGDNLQEQLSEYATSIKIKMNLHSKCYLSENAAIITSLNLYTFSQINNEEMGIVVNNNNHIYNDIEEEVERLKFNSREM